jgi:hypothetical protein
MALFNERDLRSRAQARSSRLQESVGSILRKRAMDTAARSSFHIFLSHSYLDKELIEGISDHLESVGYSVYVDWKEDSQLSRENVTREAAVVVRKRITQSSSLFFATTDRSKESRWMPWELGYMDGKKGKSAILPIALDSDSSDQFKGQEYLGIYPYIATGTLDGQEKLWVHEDAKTYVLFDKWLAGDNPYRHE